ncbi:MAG: hypothetical protein PHY30_03325 [Candidatus Pacebacteria bacterium]|nr:hypothetical protein [Candidatus Paceibacterota bacterium]
METRLIRLFVIVGNDKKGIHCLATRRPFEKLELLGGQVNDIWDDAQAEIKVLKKSDVVISAPSSKVYIGGLISPQYFEDKGLFDLVFMQVISIENIDIFDKDKVIKVYLSRINEYKFMHPRMKSIAEVGMLLYSGNTKKARKILLPGEKIIIGPHFIDKGVLYGLREFGEKPNIYNIKGN